MLDVFLAGWLIFGLPALGIARDAHTKDRMRSSQVRRWLAAACLALSASIVVLSEWTWSGRPLSSLRLGIPLSPIAVGGLALAVLLLIGIAIAGVRAPPQAAAEESGLNPRTTRDWLVFLVFITAIGAGWELLYRGFLLWWLAPRVGLPAAVAISVLAYGVGHGVRNPMRLLATLVSALAFTLGAVFSGSLYWLMMIHAGAPLIGAVLLRRSERRARAGHDGDLKDPRCVSPGDPIMHV
jgi:membrane protease YdiL (CAAX protease family)